jgi:uracil-DNA glycosylase family 4
MKLESSYIDAEIAFDTLCSKVSGCLQCSRMEGSQRVLNHSSGTIKADIMFIGEAPGRLGADTSGIPFHGDKSGHNFEELLEFAHLDRSNIFVTNSVLCNPKDEHGNNSTPTKIEIHNCSIHLAEQIKIINPKIVVTLGAVALESTKHVSQHNLSLKENVRTANEWFDRILIPVYHPGQRAMIHRSMANQRSDYQFIADRLKVFKKGVKKVQSFSKPQLNVALIIDYLFQLKSSYTYFAIHKLFYLIEYKSMLKFGNRLTNSYIIRQKDGPYCTELHLFKLKKALPYIAIKNLSATNILLYKMPVTLFEERLIDQYDIDDDIKKLIDEVIVEHGSKSNAGLKRTVYFTRPMRNILALESDKQLNLYNSPIDFVV